MHLVGEVSTAGQSQLKRIEGVDLLCGLGVVWYRCLYWNHGPQLYIIVIHFDDLFFVLSGACLFLVYSGRLAEDTHLLSYFSQYFHDLAWNRRQLAPVYLNGAHPVGLGDPGQNNTMSAEIVRILHRIFEAPVRSWWHRREPALLRLGAR